MVLNSALIATRGSKKLRRVTSRVMYLSDHSLVQRYALYRQLERRTNVGDDQTCLGSLKYLLSFSLNRNGLIQD